MNALYLFLCCWLNVDFKVMMNRVSDFTSFTLDNLRFPIMQIISLPTQLPNQYKNIFLCKQAHQVPEHSPDPNSVPI